MHPAAFRNPFERASAPLHTVVLIPARYQSSRFPGKPLAALAGRPMIEHVYRRAAGTAGVDAIVVATDDRRIAAAVEAFGGIARMTSPAHESGLDRIAEVAADLACEIVVNVQGDEPLVEPAMIRAAVDALVADPGVQMATLRRRLDDPADLLNPNVVKVVADLHGDALFFTRAPVPYPRDGGPSPRGRAGRCPVYKHIGLYVYRRSFLLALAALPRTPLEVAESLEQLRVLEHGFRIRTVDTDHDSVGVDTPEDLERLRRRLPAATSA